MNNMNQSQLSNSSGNQWLNNLVGSSVQLMISMTGITANLLLIIGHIKDPLKILQSSSSPFILNIATVDLLVSVFWVTKTFLTLGRPDFTRSERLSDIIQTTSSVFISVSFPAFFSLSVERFCAVAFPLWHRVRITPRACRYWLGTMWLANLSIEALVVGLRLTSRKNKASFLHIVYLGSSFLATLVFYFGTFLSLRKQSKNLIGRQEINKSSSRALETRLRNEKRFLLTILIVCLILAITLLPSVIYHHIVIFMVNNHLEHDKRPIDWSLMILLSINFAINPFIYLWRLPKYRRTFKKLYSN